MLWALEELGLPYALEVMPFPPRYRVEGYKDLNPLGTVPACFIDGELMTESAAIIVMLDDSYPAARILPVAGDPRRALALRWIVFIAGNMYPAISVVDFPDPVDPASRMIPRGASAIFLRMGSKPSSSKLGCANAAVVTHLTVGPATDNS